MGQLCLIPLSFTSRSRNKSRDGSGYLEGPLLSSCSQSNLCKLLLIPLSLSSGSGHQSSCSGNRKASLLSSSNQSYLRKLLLIPLSRSGRSGHQSCCSGNWKTSFPPAIPLHLSVEMVLQLLYVGKLLLQTQARDCAGHWQLG